METDNWGKHESKNAEQLGSYVVIWVRERGTFDCERQWTMVTRRYIWRQEDLLTDWVMWSEGGNISKKCLSLAQLDDDYTIPWKLILEED